MKDLDSANHDRTSIKIRTLGALEISDSGRELPSIRAKKAKLLFGYLLLHSAQEVNRARVAELLWPESFPETARFNLRQILPTFRKELGPLSKFLSSDSETLRLDLSVCWVDLFEFKRQVQWDSRAAVDLYLGPFLEGLDAEWVNQEREACRGIYISALETILQNSSPQEQEPWLYKLVEADPLRETSQQHLIRHFIQVGNRPAAVRAYRAFQEHLRRGLNLNPSAETSSILSETAPVALVAAPPGKRTHLQQPLSSFVGREKEISEIAGALSNTRLVTLIGPGGSGKTRLALKVAEIQMERHAHGVTLVELGPITDAGQVHCVIGESLGIGGNMRSSGLQEIINFLSPRRSLLLIDNCEHLLQVSGTTISAILRACPGVSTLATSRQPLGIGGEQTYLVPCLSVPDYLEVNSPEELLRFESINLFVERARLASPSFSLMEENAAFVSRVCQRLDGIPLAIELAAARLRSMQIEEIDRRLDHRFRFLVGGDRSALKHQRTLGELLDWSYDLLDDQERALWCRASVFAGGWTPVAAEKVCSGQGIDEAEILDLTISLVDKSIALIERGIRGTRYRMLETFREYGRYRLAEMEGEGVWRDRHLAYFVGLCERAESELGGPSERSWIAALDHEHDNLRSALEWANLTSPSAADLIWRYMKTSIFFRNQG